MYVLSSLLGSTIVVIFLKTHLKEIKWLGVYLGFKAIHTVYTLIFNFRSFLGWKNTIRNVSNSTEPQNLRWPKSVIGICGFALQVYTVTQLKRAILIKVAYNTVRNISSNYANISMWIANEPKGLLPTRITLGGLTFVSRVCLADISEGPDEWNFRGGHPVLRVPLLQPLKLVAMLLQHSRLHLNAKMIIFNLLFVFCFTPFEEELLD